MTPAQEFGHGWEKPRFFEDAIDAGQRDLAQRRAEAAAKKRLADQMKEQLR